MERVRDAATVILVRDRPELHVFVVRRNPALDFAPGATVFPGGAVDPADAPVAAALGVDEFRAAAARECLEECGIPVDARELGTRGVRKGRIELTEHALDAGNPTTRVRVCLGVHTGQVTGPRRLPPWRGSAMPQR